jgi:serine/threonine protein kinase
LHALFSGVEWCHQHRVFHRDLKPENILITRDRKLWVADFGNARSLDVDWKDNTMMYTQAAGTMSYRAPETLMQKPVVYGEKVDVWSLGCILGYLLMRKKIFPYHPSEEDQLCYILSKYSAEDIPPLFEAFKTKHRLHESSIPFFWDVPENVVYQGEPKENIVQLLDLCRQCLVLDPEQRIGMREALQHPYFEGCVLEESWIAPSLDCKSSCILPTSALQMLIRMWKGLDLHHVSLFKAFQLLNVWKRADFRDLFMILYTAVMLTEVDMLRIDVFQAKIEQSLGYNLQERFPQEQYYSFITKTHSAFAQPSWLYSLYHHRSLESAEQACEKLIENLMVCSSETYVF